MPPKNPRHPDQKVHPDLPDSSTFKREGPAPATNDTGNTVEEMNQRAEESLINNVRPDEAVD